MIKWKGIKKMIDSENAPVIAGIGGIVIMVGLDRVTRSRYRVEGKRDSITIEPVKESTAASVKNKNGARPAAKKTKAK